LNSWSSIYEKTTKGHKENICIQVNNIYFILISFSNKQQLTKMSISARLIEDMTLLSDAMVEPTHESSPFVNKQTVVITDNNPNASYVSSQIVFQTDSLSSNGLYSDLRNGVIEIPFVICLESLTADNGCDFTADAAAGVLGQKGLDAILSTKCSDLAFINTLSVELDGGNVVSITDNIASYLIWRKHDSQGPYSRDELCM
jgi:hypothetical protein